MWTGRSPSSTWSGRSNSSSTNRNRVVPYAGGDRLSAHFARWLRGRVLQLAGPDDDRGTVNIVDRKGTKRTVTRAWEALSGLAWGRTARKCGPGDDRGTLYSIYGSATTSTSEHLIVAAPGGILLHDVGADGRALVTRYDRSMVIEGAFDNSPTRNLSLARFLVARDLTPDGRRMLMTFSGAGSSANYDVYVRATDGADAVRVGEGQAEQFSPDGKSALAVVHGPPAKVVVLPIGPGAARTVATGSVTAMQARWLADGRKLLLVGTEPGTALRGYVVDSAGGTPLPITPQGITLDTNQVAISRDGRTIAARGPDGGVALFPIDGGAPTPVHGFEPNEMPTGWTADGRMLTLIDQNHRHVHWRRSSVRTTDNLAAVQTIGCGAARPDDVLRDGGWPLVRRDMARREETLFLVDGMR